LKGSAQQEQEEQKQQDEQRYEISSSPNKYEYTTDQEKTSAAT